MLKKFINKEIIFYVFFGVLTTVVAFSLYAVFIFFDFGVVWANTLSTFAAILFSYIVNKIWVFKTLNFSIKIIAKELFKFCIGRFFVYVLETSLLVILVDVISFNPILSKAFTAVIVVILNYVTSKKIVFISKK